MRSNIHSIGQVGPDFNPASGVAPVRSRSFLATLMVGIALSAAPLLLATAAQASPSDQAGVVASDETTRPALVAAELETALVGRERPLGHLPFTRLDLAILVAGGAIVTAAAVGAPLLLRPLRLSPSVLRGALLMRGRERSRRLLFLLLIAGIFMLAGAPAALGQAAYYTGVTPPLPPIEGTYVGAYVGPSIGLFGSPGTGAGGQPPAPGAQGGARSVVSVGVEAGGGFPLTDDLGQRFVTGRDLVTVAALGLTGVVGLAVSAGRSRSRQNAAR